MREPLNFNKMIINKAYLNIFFLVLLSLIGVQLVSCTGSKESSTTDDAVILDEDYYEFKGISLAKSGISAMIMLPDETANIGASTKPEIIHTDGDFKWDIHVGQNFHMHIEDYGDYTDLVETKKRELKESDIFKVRYLIDEKDLIVYEQTLVVKGSKKAAPTVGVEHRSFHVYGQKTIDGVTYELRSRDEGYEKVIIELMAKSVRSFKEIK
jgi:hypothetical protein